MFNRRFKNKKLLRKLTRNRREQRQFKLATKGYTDRGDWIPSAVEPAKGVTRQKLTGEVLGKFWIAD